MTIYTNLATMGSAPYHASSAYFSYSIYAHNMKRCASSKALVYVERHVYKDVRIHHATLNAKASSWLLLHTAHPARARLTPNTEQSNHRTNCNIPYIWIFWSHTSRGYDRARHTWKKWRGEIHVGHPWERSCIYTCSFDFDLYDVGDRLVRHPCPGPGCEGPHGDQVKIRGDLSEEGENPQTLSLCVEQSWSRTDLGYGKMS